MVDENKGGNYFEGPYKSEVSTNRIILEIQNYINAQIKQYRDYNDKIMETLLKGLNDKVDALDKSQREFLTAYMKAVAQATEVTQEGLKIHLAQLNNHAEKYLAQLNTSATKDQVAALDNALKERITESQKNMALQLDSAIENLQKQVTELRGSKDTLSGGFEAAKIIASLGYLLVGLVIGGLGVWFNFFKG